MLGNSWTMLKETVNDYIEDNALSRGAAIAYFTVFSIAPMLVICIAIAGLVFGQEAAQGAIVGQLQGLMGEQGAEAIQAMIASASNKIERHLGHCHWHRHPAADRDRRVRGDAVGAERDLEGGAEGRRVGRC